MSMPIRFAVPAPPRRHVAPPIPAPRVAGKNLATRLRQAFATATLHGAAVHRDARLAAPHRARMWDAARALLAARPTGEDARKLHDALSALKAFVAEFEPFADSGDEHLQTRIFSGHSPTRPGLTRLMDEVFVASGMGRVPAFADVVDA